MLHNLLAFIFLFCLSCGAQLDEYMQKYRIDFNIDYGGCVSPPLVNINRCFEVTHAALGPCFALAEKFNTKCKEIAAYQMLVDDWFEASSSWHNKLAACRIGHLLNNTLIPAPVRAKRQFIYKIMLSNAAVGQCFAAVQRQIMTCQDEAMKCPEYKSCYEQSDIAADREKTNKIEGLIDSFTRGNCFG